ncbi:hypothetical protein P5V53_08075 [Mycobacteroides abscessus subsp. abscessus]|nr:hypothetical protein [Mycobacteroides abscessus]MDO3353032.1 hypothetical protein [Mycobacteroides abscessus subsp. abscessus]SHZ57095.1 Probable peptide synthetase NRP [Mycobacteroides abscessus subsp. abscessus]SHZ66940.1 Probable peptide synthetase NRP [Mycobacteroides abscessus subsp. abscessus]SIA07957.1 Probable peptide synthetase NRP [Mycobacteroides abscessus subsp. abscessus]SIF82584.1 peptide synthetase [Mycobacteroides abscessus subsp. abscessus]
MSVDPSRTLSSLDLLDDDEHAQMATWGNQAVLKERPDTMPSIPAVFARQVASSRVVYESRPDQRYRRVVAE